MNLFLSPHHDDAVLFGSFTLLRDKPIVITVLDSYIQPSRGYPNCTTEVRAAEDRKAIVGVLGCNLTFLGFRDDYPDWAGIERTLQTTIDSSVETVYAPAIERHGHMHHNKIGEIADRIWPKKVKHYMTYTSVGKSRGNIVPYQPEWVRLKLQAMACYESQIALPNCHEHFARDLFEYYQQ